MRALVLLLALGAALLILWFVLQEFTPTETSGIAGASRPAAEGVGAGARPGELTVPAAAEAPAEEGEPWVQSRSAAPPPESDGLFVRGRLVRWDGKPLRRARVRVWEWEDPQYHVEDYEPFRREVEPSASGVFEVLVDRQGDFRVWGTAHDECSSDVVPVKVNPREPEAEVELVLPEPRRIRGRVIDGRDRRPVASADLVAFVDVERFGGKLPEGLTSVESWGRPKATSRSDGTFELFPVDPRVPAYVLQLRLRGRIPEVVQLTDGESQLVFSSPLVELPRVPPGSENVEIVLTPPEPAVGAARAELHLSVEGGGEVPEAVDVDILQIGPRGSTLARMFSPGKPSAGGYIGLPELLPGARYQLRIRKDYLVEDVYSEPFVAHLGTQVVPVVLPFSVEVEVEVRDAEGQPAPKTRLRVSRLDEEGLSRPVFSRARISSWPIRFPLLPGTYFVEAGTEGDLAASAELVVEQLPARLVLDLPE